MRHSLIAVALAVAGIAGAHAAEPPTCAIERPVTARLVADAQDLKGLGGDMLIGNLSYMREPAEDAEAASGAVLFLKRADGWKAIVPSNFENDVGIYAAADGKSVVLIAQRQIEGPGQSFTLVRTADAFATATCTELAFPAALNKPSWNNEFLVPHDFDITARGAGLLVAYAELGRAGERRRHVWYAYETRNGGAAWSTARRVGRNARAPNGLYAPLERKDAPALVAELQAYAAGRP
jgi:hypothetical protein